MNQCKEETVADYIQFVSADGSTILVEVDEGEISSTKRASYQSQCRSIHSGYKWAGSITS